MIKANIRTDRSKEFVELNSLFWQTSFEKVQIISFFLIFIGHQKTTLNETARAKLGIIIFSRVSNIPYLYLNYILTIVIRYFKKTFILSQLLYHGTYSWYTYAKHSTSIPDTCNKSNNCKY